MEITSIEIQGFKRFHAKTSVRLSERLIAVLGANESGKSTLLEAIGRLYDDRPFTEKEITRKTDGNIRISGTFALSDDDIASLDALKIVASKSVRITKNRLGHRTIVDVSDVNPDMQVKQQSARAAMESLRDILTNEKEQKELNRAKQALENAILVMKEFETPFGPAALEVLTKAEVECNRQSNNQKMPANVRSALASVGMEIKSYVAESKTDICEVLAKFVVDRMSAVILFDDKNRQLKAAYNITDPAVRRDPALVNLADLAGLDLVKLAGAVSSSDIHLREELLEAASVRVSEHLTGKWSDEKIRLKMIVDESVLRIMVSPTERTDYSAFDDRSEGLRWFVALVAFVQSKGQDAGPLVLIDEAESHLSYDAQASLVAALESQKVVAKVIYTTHSFGCLPSDLGRGLRVVVPIEQGYSRLENSFWANGVGFRPLLLAMGMSPLSFTPARNVLMGEGAADAILFPTLFRAVSGQERLIFQVAPGIAETAPETIAGLLAEGGRVAFVVDGDSGGKALKEKLVAAGVLSTQVATLAEHGGIELTVEDLVEDKLFQEAVNTELQVWQNTKKSWDVGKVPERGRMRAVKEWCKENGLRPPSKATLAQRIIEMGVGENIVKEEHAEVLRSLLEWADGQFSD